METRADSSHEAAAAGVSVTRSGPYRVWLPVASEASVVDEVLEVLAQVRFPMDRTSASPGDSDGHWLIHGGKKSDVVGVRLRASQVFAVKVIHDRRLIAHLRTALGRGKGRRAFHVGMRLAQLEAPAPRVYAYAERKPFGKAMLIMADLPGLENQPNAGRPQLSPAKQVRPATRLLGQTLAMLHAKGVCHADLSSRNILLDPQDLGRGAAIVDFEDRTFCDVPMSVELRKSQLADLAGTIQPIPVGAAMRCLQFYITAAGITGRVSSYAREIEKLPRRS